MDQDQASSEIPAPPVHPSWRMILLRAAGFGAGFAIIAALLLGSAIWWMNRPRQWSDRSITAKPTKLTMQQTGDELISSSDALTNTRARNMLFRPRTWVPLMKKLPKDSSFDKMDGAIWDSTIRIPPQQSIGVAFVMPYRFSDFNTSAAEVEPEAKLVEFAGNRLKEIDGLVFFDYASKYKIEMPKNWDVLQKQASDTKLDATAATALLPPDKGDMFDKMAACDAAEKLAQRCSAAHVSFDSSPWIKYGGWPVKLRELPKPPAGYTLDPSPETCSIAGEWRNYCKAKIK